jgi:large subunit ribosomal protein L7e
VRELIYKKGYAKIDKQRVPLTDNNLIEEVLEYFDEYWIDILVISFLS